MRADRKSREQEERDLEQQVVDDLARQWVRGVLILGLFLASIAGFVAGMFYVADTVTQFVQQTMGVHDGE